MHEFGTAQAREPGYAQATGRFRWWWQVLWWQVLGSNQPRLSRRFTARISQTIGMAFDLGKYL